jgi:two-component system sensor histidine kinase MtrB
LAISVEDARLHNGRLEAWGEPGVGSAFRLTLPLVRGRKVVGSPLPLRPAGRRRAVKPEPPRDDAAAITDQPTDTTPQPSDTPVAPQPGPHDDGAAPTAGEQN